MNCLAFSANRGAVGLNLALVNTASARHLLFGRWHQSWMVALNFTNWLLVRLSANLFNFFVDLYSVGLYESANHCLALVISSQLTHVILYAISNVKIGPIYFDATIDKTII